MTLVILLANVNAIVMASDSRQTSPAGFSDDSQKVFLVSGKRLLGIAGLASYKAESTEFSWLRLQVSAFLNREIERAATMEAIESHYWNDPPPPETPPGFPKQDWDHEPFWWSALAGPLQTIAAIEAMRGHKFGVALSGLIAGYKSSGEAKVEHRTLEPVETISNWQRKDFRVRHRRRTDLAPAEGMLCRWIGKDLWVERALNGKLPVRQAQTIRGLDTVLQADAQGTAPQLSEDDLVALAEDLITVTASNDEAVGGPVQLGILRPSGDNMIRQETFPRSDNRLGPSGSWFLGHDFEANSDYPFVDVKERMVLVGSKIESNRSPIRLDNNFIYGNTFINARFLYSGGPVHFNDNQILGTCTLQGLAEHLAALSEDLREQFEVTSLPEASA